MTMTTTTIPPTSERLAGLNGQAEPVPQSTALAKINSGGAILSMANASGNPLAFLSDMGKQMAYSGMLGLKKPEQGSTLLLICITEQKSPLSVIQEYHLMDDGKMTKKADWVLARFREIGGTFKILKDGTDGFEASYTFTFAGNTQTVSYTMDDAKTEGIIKPGSRWTKNPPSMLRARVITNGVRMVAPEVFAGFNTVEELEGQDFVSAAPSTPTASRTRKSATQQATEQPAATPTEKTAATDQTIVDAKFHVTDENPPFDSPATASPTADDSARTAALMEIELLWGANGKTMADLVSAISAKFPEVKTVDDMSDERINGILENLRKKSAAAEKAKVEAAGASGE
jgi:hypothetical protein